MKIKKLKGTSLKEFMSWLLEPNITPEKISKRLEKNGINEDLFNYMNHSFKSWEARKN